jgi:hypothetical protein
MMNQPDSRDNGSEYTALRRMREDADELLRAAERARQVIEDRRSSGGFSRWSEFLSHVVPADPVREDRIARAVELDPQILRAVRDARVDPLHVPARPLHVLARTLGVDESFFRALVGADHDRFVAAARVFRTGRADDAAAWLRFETTWQELEEEDPSRFEP